jgi:homoaconitase/3-isopropylmalate dehydratase large subunit
MGMTMTEKILAQHAGRDAVQAGDLLVAQVDLVLANDITGPPAIAEFEKIGRPVFDKDKIALVPDHFSPCKDIKSATMCKRMRDFARRMKSPIILKLAAWVSSMRFYLTAVLLLPVRSLLAPILILVLMAL